MKPVDKRFVEAVFATLLTLVCITLLDIFVIVTLDAFRVPFFNPWFWWIPLGFIEFFLPLAVSWFLESRLPLLNYLFFLFGIEDTLFYLIAYRHIPDTYCGIYYLVVFFGPPKHLVLAGNLVAVGLAVALVYGFRRRL